MRKLYMIAAMMFIAAFTKAQSCQPATAFDYLDVNNVKARINNGGDMWWDLVNDAEYFVPQTGNVSAQFAGALWIGGIDDEGNLHVAAQTYRQTGNDFFPGPLDQSGNITTATCENFDRIWKMNKSTVDSFNAGQFTAIPTSILEWPGRGNPNLGFVPLQHVAPFVDFNGDDIYDPSVGDYPAITGDQALWFVINDVGNIHSETGSLPLGIEVRCMAYAFKGEANCLSSTTFYHYSIEKKGTGIFDSVYVGVWNDPDLGCPFDDYIGSDSLKNLGIVYNATATDGGSGCLYVYGNDPPVGALQLLKGPTDGAGTIRHLDHFMYYNNDFSMVGNPEEPEDYYGYLQSIWKDGSHLTSGGTGYGGSTPVNYAFSGDPSSSSQWSECAESNLPFDRRMIISSGPFTLESNATQTFDVAVLWDQNSIYPCPSFTVIGDVADCVQDYFDNSVVFTGIDDGPLQTTRTNALNVFPNPSGENEVISFQFDKARYLEIFDIAGRKVEAASVSGLHDYSVKSSLVNGLYIYKILFSDGTEKTGKLVVQ